MQILVALRRFSVEGVSHLLNGIALQAQQFSPDYTPPEGMPTIAKSKHQNVHVIIGQGIPIFTSGYPWWLPFRTHVEVTSTQIKTNALKMTLLWILVRLHGIENANMSRRTGFNVVVQNKRQVSNDNVRYLPIIVILATDMSTMFEVHRQSLKIGTISSFTPSTSFLIVSSTLR